MVFKLGYTDRLVDATITLFLNSAFMEKDQVQKNNAMSEGKIVCIILLFLQVSNVSRVLYTFVNSVIVN